MIKPHIVIVGAGFGGMYVAKSLSKYVKSGEIDVTIINKTNYFLFTPLLHEVATGGLSASSVSEPLREVFAGTGINIALGEVKTINITDRRINVGSATIHYDYLLLATGADTNYYDISGAEHFSVPLKSLEDALKIRSKIIRSFELALYESDPEERLKHLSFAIVGGGPTGVEIAGELADFLEELVKRYYSNTNRCKKEETSVHLIDSRKELLERFPAKLRTQAKERLLLKGVNIHNGLGVTNVNRDGLILSDGSKISATNVIWCAGVKPSIPFIEDFQPELLAGRLLADEFFRMRGQERVFLIGDVAGYTNNEGKPLPMLAQVAVRQAITVANNLLISAGIQNKALHNFSFKMKGSMVSIGQWFAIGKVYSLNISGKLTWWLWRTVYLFKFVSKKKRLRIAFEWTLNLFLPRDITVD